MCHHINPSHETFPWPSSYQFSLYILFLFKLVVNFKLFGIFLLSNAKQPLLTFQIFFWIDIKYRPFSKHKFLFLLLSKQWLRQGCLERIKFPKHCICQISNCARVHCCYIAKKKEEFKKRNLKSASAGQVVLLFSAAKFQPFFGA